MTRQYGLDHAASPVSIRCDLSHGVCTESRHKCCVIRDELPELHVCLDGKLCSEKVATLVVDSIPSVVLPRRPSAMTPV
jgi:hypothetical protein